jgi:hypothetical protein
MLLGVLLTVKQITERGVVLLNGCLVTALKNNITAQKCLYNRALIIQKNRVLVARATRPALTTQYTQ